jgi:2-polyprenyl-3-methyl-5-hydroxy-6-metoxy-1,4-benzoquinol methylase
MNFVIKIVFKNNRNSSFIRLLHSTKFNYNNENSSINEHELDKFKKMAHTWWIDNGPYDALHRMNSLRVPWICNTMKSYKNGDDIDDKCKPLSSLNILDVGCGGGILSEVII